MYIPVSLFALKNVYGDTIPGAASFKYNDTGEWRLHNDYPDMVKIHHTRTPIDIGVHIQLRAINESNSNRIVVVDRLFNRIIAAYIAPNTQTVSDFLSQVSLAINFFSAQAVVSEHNDNTLINYLSNTSHDIVLKLIKGVNVNTWNAFQALADALKRNYQGEQQNDLFLLGEDIREWGDKNLPLIDAYLNVICPFRDYITTQVINKPIQQ